MNNKNEIIMLEENLLMEPIDISNNINDFKQVFESESRIIFSAKFGDGKSYFLNEFMKSYDEKKNDYYFITLHPVNYVVEENRDVIEYIKRDILFQLIKDNRIYVFKEAYDKIFDAFAMLSLCLSWQTFCCFNHSCKRFERRV